MNRIWYFYTILFFSGISALIYEVSWNRQIGLLFGYTAQSAGIVISIYFLGMALGYWWAGKTIDKTPTPLRHYAIAEIIAGGWSFLIPTFLQISHSPSLLTWVNHTDIFVRISFRVSITVLILLPAVIALGYSFPAFARFIATQKQKPDKFIITSYSLNTVGAFLGVFLSGTFFLYYLGVATTNYLAASISIICGLIALVISLKIENNSTVEPIAAPVEAPTISLSVYSLAILSGFSILGLEVLYTHLFSLISYNSTYNFTATLCSFLISLSLGGFIVAQIKNRAAHFFIWICLAISLAIPLSLQIFEFTTSVDLFASDYSFIMYLLSYFLLNLLIVIVPITVAAMILPLCWDHLTHHQGKIIGHITFINTMAAAIGSGITTFVMIPIFGLYVSFIFFAIVYLCASIALFYIFGNRKHIFAICPIWITVLCLCLFLPKTGEYHRKGYEKIWHQETFYGPIEVIRKKSSGNLKLTQNYHYTLGSSFAESREKRQAHIPILLHSQPKKVAFLGMGTGMTAKGALVHKEVEHIDVIELIPEVVEAAKLFHQQQNNIFNDPRVHFIINDARHHLYQKSNKYDVIISDLFIPWYSYTGYLYTKEHYQIASESLEPGGIFCQWLPLYQLGKREFEMIANGFSSVFPHTSLWRGERNNKYPLMALIGSKQEIKIHSQNLLQRLKRITGSKRVKVKLQTTTVGVVLPEDKLLEPKNFFLLYICEWEQNGKLFNSDEHPRVEFLAPITERRGEFLRSEVMDGYYLDVLDKLPRKKMPKFAK